jgi:hypothetical protein
MELNAAKIVAEKAIQAIKNAIANDPAISHFDCHMDGLTAYRGEERFVLKLVFLDSTKKPTSILGGPLTDQIAALGGATAGTMIMSGGKRYKVISAARKCYHAVDDNGKAWSVKFSGSTLAKN